MIVVADNGPLHYLILLQHIDLLQRFYGQVLVPEPVSRQFGACWDDRFAGDEDRLCERPTDLVLDLARVRRYGCFELHGERGVRWDHNLAELRCGRGGRLQRW